MANAVQIAAQLYECRDAARTLLGDKYPERMREYGQSIRSVAAVKGCSELKAGKMLAEAAGGGMTAVLVLAATVEIIEPSDSFDDWFEDKTAEYMMNGFNVKEAKEKAMADWHTHRG